MALHSINKAGSHSDLWTHCLAALSADDALVLWGDASYALIDTALLESVKQTGCALYVMADDCQCRGVQTGAAALLSDADYVGLCVAHHPQVSWY